MVNVTGITPVTVKLIASSKQQMARVRKPGNTTDSVGGYWVGMNQNAKMVRRFSALVLLLPFALKASGQHPISHPLNLRSTKQAPMSLPSFPSPGAPPVMVAQDVGVFFDGMMPLLLKQDNIAGAVVIIVKDGKILYSKGYGYSDVKDRRPVTPHATLFRPASISKLFTWTAVMQLVQAGKIDLDRNVNDYLDFKIPDTFSKPITMRNLMTHTPGFEEASQDLIIFDPKDALSLREYVKTHLPVRVFPPGVTPAYSNYGAALAGYIVQRVSGMPYDEYIEKNILQPLNMQHSTFQQPLPASLTPLMSNGYASATGRPRPFEISSAPVGGLSTTADDISHFILAHLQGGEYDGARILNSETVQIMHSRQLASSHAQNPAVHSMCLGFYEESRNGHRIIGHDGDTNYFRSNLSLIPDANVGLFVSFNSAGNRNGDPREALLDQFLNRYFPYTVPVAHPVDNAIYDAHMVAGQYRSSIGSFTNINSVSGALYPLMISAKPDGTILAGRQHLEEIAPLVYREIGGQRLMAFYRNPKGGLRVSGDDPTEIHDRVSWPNGRSFNMFLIYFVPVICALTLIFWPFSAWMRKYYNAPMTLTEGQRWRRIAIRLICIVNLIYCLAWVTSPISPWAGAAIVTSHSDPTLRFIQIVGWIGSVGTILVIYCVITNWNVQREWWLSHIGNIAIICSCVIFSWFLFHWHLLHFNLKY